MGALCNVYTASDLQEAYRLRSALDAEGIVAFIANEALRTIEGDALFLGHDAPVIQVATEDREAAVTILLANGAKP